MLKLTLYDDNRTVYVSPRAISSMWRCYGDRGTHIQTESYQHVVCERPEQIMAMPEMLYELFPPMQVRSGHISVGH